MIEQAVAHKYGGEAALAASYLEKLIHLSFTLLPLRPDDIAELVRGVSDEATGRWANLFAAALPPNPRTALSSAKSETAACE